MGISFWPGAFERIIQAIRMVDEFRRSLALDAHDSAVGMIEIRIEPSYSAILDDGDGGAVCGTKRAVSADSAHGIH